MNPQQMMQMFQGARTQQEAQQIADQMWAQSPTDMVGMGLEQLAPRFGFQPPWERQQQQQPMTGSMNALGGGQPQQMPQQPRMNALGMNYNGR